jgi:predicted nucleic acid-binding Zn ribbon protein
MTDRTDGKTPETHCIICGEPLSETGCDECGVLREELQAALEGDE